MLPVMQPMPTKNKTSEPELLLKIFDEAQIKPPAAIAVPPPSKIQAAVFWFLLFFMMFRLVDAALTVVSCRSLRTTTPYHPSPSF